ncbi:DNA-binding transcriptional regulator, LysR family [Pseudomonas sp. NFACC49-2]|uniref:LysR family transcriptional regulator n=1 Tax=Pseudomonas TaxID=286 RepID=UPI000920A236|nr:MULTISPECIES: LysR family transcriptional regulator [Pseudomonas]MDT8909281.1 LysR family transcriptional regulator [Pseudomonas prosekii]SFX75561.1 DNA-binding transcriptional regulator, LysR family [Pseudomonas sp. NFACC49-2]
MIRIDDLALFVRTAALGSFSNAAREVDLLPGQVAAAIKRLERELDVRLFARSTRSLRLTAEGEQYLPNAQTVLDTLREGREKIRRESAELRGVLQVAAPSDLGRNVLLPWLSEFRHRHPQLSLRYFLSDQVADMFRDPVDVAIRYGQLDDANYIALPLAPWNRRVLVASPDYLHKHGRPRTPDDLLHHDCLLYTLHGRVYDKWRLGARVVSVSGPLFSDDADVVRRWALAGEGITYRSWLDLNDDIGAGRLEVLLPDHPGEPLPLSFVCPHRKQFSAAVQQLHSLLRSRFAELEERSPKLV